MAREPDDRGAARVPRATYRVQFTPSFGFDAARDLADYLDRLGISDLYASPIFRARPGSEHGYDVADPTALNPELGGESAFLRLSDRLRELGMGLLLDIVPNHMAASAENPWWRDVLARGERSEYAGWFDVDWRGGAEACAARGGEERGRGPEGRTRVVLPVLGATLQEVLGKGELRLTVDGKRGFEVAYHEARWPVHEGTWGPVLEFVDGRARAVLDDDAEAAAAWRGVHETVDAAERGEAGGDGAAAALAAALASHPALAVVVEAALGGFDGLEDLLGRQGYRLEWWREGAGSINYRRFFDITDLVGVRVENPEVAEATHGLIRGLVAAGRVTGLRVDHIDGLRDPAAYLGWLERTARGPEDRPVYTVVEKILAPDEALPAPWPVAGTSGYDALNALNRVLVDDGGLRTIDAQARRLLSLPGEVTGAFEESAFEGKRLALERLFPGESARLGRRLISAVDEAGIRGAATDDDLRAALAAATASMAVYRTYVDEHGASGEDRARIGAALAGAASRGATGPALTAMRRVLLLDVPEGRDACLEFARSWQQLTGPVVAKGVEDTALYRHLTLTSLNEVGGGPEPTAPPASPTASAATDPVAAFHAFFERAARERPHSMVATSTHDTKRSEDVRARLAVLSELGGEWASFCERWVATAAGERDAPTARDRMLLVQSLLGVWPLEWDSSASVASRVKAYLVKAAREAKVQTGWTDPNAAYERNVQALVDEWLGGGGESPEFLRGFLPLARRASHHGALNSLSQALLKFTVPGVPDMYQGCEAWDLSLVDPDNRRAVDFARRRAALAGIEAAAASDRSGLCREVCGAWRDGWVKVFLTWAALRARREHPELFERGGYEPLGATGPHATRLIAFARRHGDHVCVAAVPRLSVALLGAREGGPLSMAGAAWNGTRLDLGSAARTTFTDAFTGSAFLPGEASDPARLFASFPVALLIGRA